MNTSHTEFAERRRRTGIATAVLLSCGVVGLVFADSTAVWPAACLRIGIVLAALWTCFPTRTRPAAWAFLRPERLFVLGLVLWFLPRLKPILPVVAVVLILLWFLRPRRPRR
ncbi:MAG: hypothetical protein ACKO3T_16875 [Planctomycetaceae bacterium]